MVKVISYAVSSPPQKQTKAQLVEYPELQKYLDDGYEIMEMLPPWGGSSAYFVTFMIEKDEEEKPKQKLQRRSK